MITGGQEGRARPLVAPKEVRNSTVEVAGPESALKRLQAAVTESVSIQDQTRTVREVVTIGVPDSSLRLRSPQTAVVTVTISPRQP